MKIYRFDMFCIPNKNKQLLTYIEIYLLENIIESFYILKKPYLKEKNCFFNKNLIIINLVHLLVNIILENMLYYIRKQLSYEKLFFP